jgi:uncharacterized protein with PIN domain
MLVVDSSAWVEWLTDGPLTSELSSLFPARDPWIVPTIVQQELMKWLPRERGEEAADEFLAFTQRCVVSVGHWDCRGSCHYLPRAHNAGLLTCDVHFEELAGVTSVAKAGQ